MVGKVTGDTYQLTGMTRATYKDSLQGGASTLTYVQSYQLIGPGQANNLRVREVAHITRRGEDVIVDHDDCGRSNARSVGIRRRRAKSRPRGGSSTRPHACAGWPIAGSRCRRRVLRRTRADGMLRAVREGTVLSARRCHIERVPVSGHLA